MSESTLSLFGPRVFLAQELPSNGREMLHTEYSDLEARILSEKRLLVTMQLSCHNCG